MTLEDLGWNEAFAEEFSAYVANGWKPARLIRDNKITYGALLGDGREVEVVMSGKVYHDAGTDAELPAVGDWVALEIGDDNNEHVIRARLSRQTCFSRKMSGRRTEEQVIAANIQVVVVVTDAGPDFNLRRMERYFAIIGRSRAKAVVLLNKADLFSDEENRTAAEAIRTQNPEAEVHVTSLKKKRGLNALKEYLKPGISITFIGSSGTGKSSVINHLLGGDYQWTDKVNDITGKGRHTTTARELMVLRGGGIIIDNPGIREVHMWTDETTLREQFADIEELARHCRFDNCRHGPHAGCAIRAAMAEGKMELTRLEGFLKLEEEIAKLRLSRQKRRMTIARRDRRDYREKSRRYDARRNRDFEE
ncbi:MAG: ribosome small subunit-dependent GTPase A [Chthoniobacterales bacterium]